MTQPDFWSDPPGLRSRLLAPFGWLFDQLGRLNRRSAVPDRLEVPVICVGNVNVGGTGKTPTAIAVADRLASIGLNVHFLSRGYLGRLQGPQQVDLAHHDAKDVGDEAMLLAAHAPTWVSRNRGAGALAAVRAGAQIIVMDDGLQNSQLHKDLSFLVIDGAAGFGNGKVMPAGPLREPVARGLQRADAVVIIGEGGRRRDDVAAALRDFQGPVFRASLSPPASIGALRGVPVFAFAGIGRPEKFFDMLRAHGVQVAGTRKFADHYDFSADDMARLVEEAGAVRARLVTTAKDYARLDQDARTVTTVIPVDLVVEERALLDQLLATIVPDRLKTAFD